MKFRQLSIILGVVIFIGAFLLFQFLAAGPDDDTQVTTNGVEGIGVPVITAYPSTITSRINFTGSVIPEQEIQLFSEVQGVLSESGKTFEEGTSFRTGETIIKIDDREQIQFVKNLKSQFQSLLTQSLADIKLDYPDEFIIWSDYLNDLNVDEMIADLPESPDRQFNLFLSGRNIPSSFYNIKQAEVRLSKYQIKAPFSGVITLALLEPGTLVRPNQSLGQFTQVGNYEIEASINASDRFFITPGDDVNIHIENDEQTDFEAEVARINARIDAATQTLLVYLKVDSERLLAGQYVSGEIDGELFENAQKIASKSLVRNNMIFVAENNVAKMKEIEVLANEKDSVIVRGLNSGDLVIDEFRDASFEGTRVIPVQN